MKKLSKNLPNLKLASELLWLCYKNYWFVKWPARFLTLIIALLFLGFVFRTPMLRLMLNNKISQFNESYNAELKIEDVRFVRYATVRLSQISLKGNNSDTLLKVARLGTRINLFKAFTGRVSIRSLEADQLNLSITRTDSGTNYSFLIKSDTHRTDTIKAEVNYNALAKGILNLFFDKLPSDYEINDFSLLYSDRGDTSSFYCKNFITSHHSFDSEIKVRSAGSDAAWKIKGLYYPQREKASLIVYSEKGVKLFFPVIENKYRAKIGFDTLTCDFSVLSSASSGTGIRGKFSASGLLLNYFRLSKGDLLIDHTGIDCIMHIGKNSIEIDSSSEMNFNQLSFNPYFYYAKDSTRHVRFSILKKTFSAQAFYNSLPKGAFQQLEGMEAKGDLSWFLRFSADWDRLDSLVFESKLEKKNFRLIKFGKTNFAYINQPFMHTAYKYGNPVRTFVVGPENPNFRPLEQIPWELRQAVLFSEDGAFYWHNGFLPEAFRESLVANLKAGRFVRGGSTISMQLVKNVFLTPEKTITRKVEELIITWLIENCGMVSKDRMFEVYLNIIEWGPGIYGAGEASYYYFDKDVSKLALNEAIFMASIIPRPASFRYAFTKDGHLRDYFAEHCRFVAGRMLMKEVITQEQFDNLIPDVELKGRAKLLVIPADNIPTDSLMLKLSF